MIRTLDPRFPKPVLYQAELYPEFRLDPLPEGVQKGNMVDLSSRWPLGLNKHNWWAGVALAGLVFLIAAVYDREILVALRDGAGADRSLWEQLTRYGESDWILYPSGILTALSIIAAYVAKSRLWQITLKQFAGFFGFVFVGVGLPTLISSAVKRLIGRGRPELSVQEGLYSLSPNWSDWLHQSFPSGHATTAFSLAIVIAFLSPRWTYVVLAFAGGIAISRVILGVHFPTDVVAGALLGVMGAYFVRYVFASRRWAFESKGMDIVVRPFSALRRLSQLRRRRSAKVQQPNQP